MIFTHRCLPSVTVCHNIKKIVQFVAENLDFFYNLIKHVQSELKFTQLVSAVFHVEFIQTKKYTQMRHADPISNRTLSVSLLRK